jgi:hypothetical protein
MISATIKRQGLLSRLIRMTYGKLLATGLLLIAVVLAASQTVRSQEFATTTITSLLTASQVSTVPVGTQVLTTTTGQITPVFSAPVTIPGTHGVCGVFFVHAFNGTAGQGLVGSVTASSSVDVYVMTAAVFQAWSHQVVAGGNCTPSSLVATQKNTTAYDFTTLIPFTGTYDLVVNNLSESVVTAQVNANLTSSAPSPATVVAYSTMTQQMIQTLMQTSVQTQTQQPTSSGPDMTTLAGIIIAIIVIAAAAYLAKTKLGKTAK